MIQFRLACVALATLALGACVEVPTQPTVAVMPAQYKPFEVFQADEQVCRGFAQQQFSSQGQGTESAGDGCGQSAYCLQRRYNIVYEQCMYSRGNQIPGFAPTTNVPPPPGLPPPSYSPPPSK